MKTKQHITQVIHSIECLSNRVMELSLYSNIPLLLNSKGGILYKIIYRRIFLLFLIALLAGCGKESKWIATAPAGSLYTNINYTGRTVLPNGRFLTPEGKQIVVAPHPYGLVLSPDGKTCVTANSGVRPFSITIIRNIESNNPVVRQIPPGYKNDKKILDDVFMGLAISPDNKTLYVAGGEDNKIYIFNLSTDKKIGFINCAVKTPDADYTDGYIGDMILSKDGSRLYALDQIGFRLIVIDTRTNKILNNVPTGRYPFGITLSPDGKYAYVANVGMYAYKRISSFDPAHPDKTSLAYPPFAYLSKESVYGIHNDSIDIPGLGEPNTTESFSVWAIDIGNHGVPKVTAKIKTGILVGQVMNGIPAVGGSSPNSVAATNKYIFVSNGNDDCISVIDVKKDSVIKNIFLNPDKRLKELRGVIPFGLAIDKSDKRLYVAEAGIDAIGVIDIPKLSVIGHIPVGWFPSKIVVTNDDKKLIVTNGKGFGSGPNGGAGFTPGPEGTYVGFLMRGSISILNIPNDEQLKADTKKVIEDDFKFVKSSNKEFEWRKNNPIPLYPGQKSSPIKHIILIIKENRTYDQVLGQYKEGDGDSTLAQYGAHVTFTNRENTDTVRDVTVMPNHLALASKFATSDNYYTDSDCSAYGHRWLADTYPNEWVETSVPATYGGSRKVKVNSRAPGMLAFVGAKHAMYPEDYNEDGSIWEHLDRNKIDFYNFGFGLQFANGYEPGPQKQIPVETKESNKGSFKSNHQIVTGLGMRYIVNYPVPVPMYYKSSRMYPTFNLGIPDQYRAGVFIKEFTERWLNGKKEMPPVITMVLPNDHGGIERPADGYPFIESYMADNDLALGRIIEFISHTKYWKSAAIFVTEDDAQSGQDHIDAHRSVLLVISPYVKRGYVSKVHYSFGSLFKTFWNVLGIPYLNQYDAGATDLADLFTDKPDFTPYKYLPEDNRIFNVKNILTPTDKNFDWKAVNQSPQMDDPDDMQKWSKEDYKELRESIKIEKAN